MKKEYNFSKMKEVKSQRKFMTELRKYNTEYYNTFTNCKDDILFYERFVSDNVSILELGYGTGRVTIPLAETAKQITGVDISKEMILKAKKQVILLYSIEKILFSYFFWKLFLSLTPKKRLPSKKEVKWKSSIKKFQKSKDF